MAADDTRVFKWFKCSMRLYKSQKMRILREYEFTNDLKENKKMVLMAEAVCLRLMAEACSHDGYLLFDDSTPYSTENLARVAGCPIDIFESIFKALKDVNLIEITPKKEVYLCDLEEYVGSETGAAIRKRKFRAGKRAEQEESEEDDEGTDGGQAGDNKGTSGEPVPKSIRDIEGKSIRGEDISASHSPACAGAREDSASPSSDSPFDLDWFIADFERMDQFQRISQGKVVTRQELEAWYDWQNNVGQWHLGGGLAITKANYRRYVLLAIPKIRRMLRERAAGGDAGMSLHQITREEFAAYCSKLNEGFSIPQITSEEEEAVWSSLVALNYHLLNGQLVTTGNIGYFTRPELKRIREEAEANRSQEEQEDVYQNPTYRKFVAFFHDSVELLNLKARIGLDGIKRMASYPCLAQVAAWSKQGLCPNPEDLHKYDVKDLAFKAFDKVRRIQDAEKAAMERNAGNKS